ncbi:MAG: NAD(P)/FAD-dependent oxidoreductase [Erysipelotrichaceae bacterium]|nr:NAD(P)/FAD-dependent oxidoreductase [Erysipelotrichaceae bacterium]
MKYDVIVIGGGVTGCAILRELSKYDLKIALLEKEEDVCSGTSKANSAIIHAGYDAQNGTLKARLNVRGSLLTEGLAKDLNFAYRKNGSFVLCFDEEDLPGLNELYERGVKNGVKDLEIISGDRAREMEPNLSKNVVAALYAPTAAIVCPFEMTIALGENAVANGAEVFLNEKVEKIEKTADGFRINDRYETKTIVNAAGLYGDVIHNMVCDEKIELTPRKGDYCLFDKEVGSLVKHTIFQLPNKFGKGVLVAPTAHGNMLVGPSATDITDKEATATTAEDLDMIIEKSKMSVDGIPFNKVITSFSGLRARPAGDDFIIREAADAFYDAIGIESPGLSSAPAVGEYVAEMIVGRLGAAKKDNFISKRAGLKKLAKMPMEERKALIEKNPLYGNIICRCEEISEGEIVDAIHSPIPATSLDAVKRRVRAGMGRCQGGFCSPKVMEILARELGRDYETITKNNADSRIVYGKLGEDE